MNVFKKKKLSTGDSDHLFVREFCQLILMGRGPIYVDFLNRSLIGV